MKIASIRPHIIGAERNFLFVVVETDTGLKGMGEGGITWREQAQRGYVQDMSHLLIGEDPFRTEHLWQVMFRSGFFPADRIGSSAISAIDIALWDIKAQALGVPLYQLLGGLVRDRVACYPHVRGNSASELASGARQRVAEGWKFIRTEVRPEADGKTFAASRAVERTIDDFAALREAVGENIELLVDVHTRLDPSEALTLCRGLEPYRPYFVEDPLRCENLALYRQLRQRTSVPLAAGEQFASKWEFRPLLEENLIDFARIDLCICGGITESLKVAHWCETSSTRLALHNPLGPVSTAACLHLDLVSTHFGVQELPRFPGTYLTDLFPRQVTFADGHLQPPTVTGLGVTMDETQVVNYPPLERGGCPQYRRPDGSFTNW